jgi:antitoxin (DNA-binding transcriptional repressor) of toxin-antitoxin stability system
MKANATQVVRNWSSYLLKVQQGFTVDIVKSGKLIARLSPATGGMSGKDFAAILRQQRADPVTADEMARLLKEQEDHERTAIVS